MEYIYAALLLHKLGQSVNEENLTKVIKATSVSVDEAKIKTLMAALNGVDIAKELENAATMAMAAPAAGATEAKKEEKKKEEAPSESAAGLASLFG
ncbi:50S ribosomal protein P1 [Candidatus Pacearchaeota archaeon]|nr:50S ribosomal protein P1 [Candidatus Pacearchaeota archaeon]